MSSSINKKLNSQKNNRKAFKASLITAAITATFASTAFAQQAEPAVTENEMESIEVVGATTNTEITPEQLAKFQAKDLADIFRQTPSVTVGGSLGVTQKVYVRGLEDTMLNVTVDGAPQTSSLFHHIGRVSIEPELLDSVEVQSGAGEATSGTGAVGGAIRFNTKDADDLLEDDQAFGGIVKASMFSNNGHKESLSLFGKLSEEVGVLASYVNVSHDNFDDGDGNEVFGTAADQTLAFVKVNAQLTDNQELTASYENRKEEGDFAKQTNWGVLEGAELYASEGERETLTLNHKWYLNDLVNLETTVYSTDSSFKRELYTWEASIETTGFDIRNTSDLGDHTLTYGLEQKVDKVHAQSFGDFGGVYDEEGTVTGLYVQDHWQIQDDLLLSFGLRHDTYELDHQGTGVGWAKIDGVWIAERDSDADIDVSLNKQDGVSINAGFVYNITDSLNFSAGYAEALRGRQVADAFTIGELDINEALVPEEVVNQELGLVYNDGTFILEASAYVSVINDVVFDKFKGKEGVLYENIGDLETAGFEFVAGYQGNNVDVVLSYNSNNVELNNAPFTWADATDSSGYSTKIYNGIDLSGYEYAGLGNAVGDSINLSVNYELNDQLSMGFNANYVADLKDIEIFHRSVELEWLDQLETIEKPGYTVVDAFIRYQPIESVNIDLAVQNLFNEQYLSHGSVADYGQLSTEDSDFGYDSVVGINEAGRDIRLTVSYQF